MNAPLEVCEVEDLLCGRFEPVHDLRDHQFLSQPALVRNLLSERPRLDLHVRVEQRRLRGDDFAHVGNGESERCRDILTPLLVDVTGTGLLLVVPLPDERLESDVKSHYLYSADSIGISEPAGSGPSPIGS